MGVKSRNWCMIVHMLDPMITKHLLTDAQYLGWARAIRSDETAHSDARVRRACRIFLSDSSAYVSEQDWARAMLAILQEIT